MKIQMLKNKALISILLLNELHVFFRGLKTRVDWYLLIEHTRRLDYAVMYFCKHTIYLILAYCLLFPKGIHKETKVFIFMFMIADMLHYLLLSHIGFEWVKVILVLLSFVIYKKFRLC